jgi:hypothetical protein
MLAASPAGSDSFGTGRADGLDKEGKRLDKVRRPYLTQIVRPAMRQKSHQSRG